MNKCRCEQDVIVRKILREDSKIVRALELEIRSEFIFVSFQSSPELTDFVSRVLVREADARWSADQLLGHRFLANAPTKEALVPLIPQTDQ